MSFTKALASISLYLGVTFSFTPGIAQVSGFQLEEGQILEYEYRVKIPSGGSWEYSYYYQINVIFEVLAIENFSYRMKMSLGEYKEYIKLEGNDRWMKRHGRSTIQNAKNYFPFFDENENLTFTMTSNGELSEFEGIEGIEGNEGTIGIFDRAMQRLKAHQPDYRLEVSYDYMQERYGEDYYRLLIHEILRPYPVGDQDREFFENDQEGKLRLRIDPNGYMQYLFADSQLTDSMKIVQDQEDKSIVRDVESGIVQSSQLLGIDWLDYCWYNFNQTNNGGFEWDHDWIKGHKSIKLVGNYNQNQLQGLVIGSIKNAAGQTIHFFEAPKLLFLKDQPTQITAADHQQEWKVDLSKGAGFVDLYFKTTHQYFNIIQQFSTPDHLRFYLRPGDTVHFDLDLENFGQVKISGSFQRENAYINSFHFLEQQPEKTENLRYAERDYQLILDAPKDLDQGFLERAQFEYQYYLYGLRIGQWGFPTHGTPMTADQLQDSLSVYSPYLDNSLGKHSEAYHFFLRSYAYSFKKLNYDGIAPGRYETEAAFKNWDRYFLLGHVANEAIVMPPIGYQFYDKLKSYERYIDEYADTEIGNYLKERMQLASRFHCGQTLPDVLQNKIREHNGGKLPEGYLFLSNDPKFYNSTLPTEKFLEKIEDIGTVVVLLPKDTLASHQTQINAIVREHNNIFVIGIDEKYNQEIEGMKSGPMIVDPARTIIGYNALFEQIDVYDPQSWPIGQPKDKKPRNYMGYIYILVGALIGTLIVRLITWRKQARLRLKKRLVDLELEAVRSRMNPHFLFNALGSIQNLINQNQVEEANAYLASFGSLIRRILDQSNETIITLKEEIELLHDYLDMERLCGHFSYEIVVDPALNPNEIELPPLLIQPHVENAIIHGIAKLGKEGRISIEFNMIPGNLEVLISDNGAGIKQGSQSSNGLGRGWKMTHQRIALLKKQWGEDICVELIEDENNSGTLVMFVIPIEKSVT